jgi:hypothetical protein
MDDGVMCDRLLYLLMPALVTEYLRTTELLMKCADFDSINNQGRHIHGRIERYWYTRDFLFLSAVAAGSLRALMKL